MDQFDVVVPEKPEVLRSDILKAEMVVLAKCVIRVGYVCTVYFPDHNDPESYQEHRLYHNQNARVINIWPGPSVDLEMTTGAMAGSMVTRVDPRNLFFWGPFVSSTDVG